MQNEMIKYQLSNINEIIEILNHISSDTKGFQGMNLVSAIVEINRLLHSGVVYLENAEDSSSLAATEEDEEIELIMEGN